MWADVATQTRRDAETSALITKETGIANADKLARAAAARLTPEWDRSSRNGGPSSCRWCDETFGLTMWQYNCRACGWKVCGECSPNEMELMQWLEGHKPHELRREPSNARLRVCVGCWYAAQAAAARENADAGSQQPGRPALWMGPEEMAATLEATTRPLSRGWCSWTRRPCGRT